MRFFSLPSTWRPACGRVAMWDVGLKGEGGHLGVAFNKANDKPPPPPPHFARWWELGTRLMHGNPQRTAK